MASFTPIISTMPAGAIKPDKKETEKGEGLLDEDIYKKLIGTGLTNDVNAFVAEIEGTNTGDFPYLNAGKRRSVLQTLAKVNEIINNKEAWNKAKDDAVTAGGYGEVAIDSNKNMYYRDKNNKITAISIQEYKNKKEKPHVMTVSEVMNARNYDPSLTMNRRIFSVAQNSKGLKKITDRIQHMMGMLSEASTETERHYSKKQKLDELKRAYGKAPSKQTESDIIELTKLLNTPGNYYKVIEKHASKRSNINRALKYIWHTLGEEEQTKLEAVASISGGGDPTALIYDMLISNTESTVVSKISPESPTQVYGSKSTANEESLTNFQMFHKDKLRDPLDKFSFNDPELGVLFKGSIGASGALVTAKDQSIPMATVETILTKLGFNQFLDPNKMYFGDKKMDQAERNNVIFDGSDVAKVYMPVDSQGAPDYNKFELFKKIYKHYEENKDSLSSGEIETLFLENGFNIDLDKNKVLVANNSVKPFLVMYGYTNDATSLIDNNNWIRKLSKNEEDYFVPKLEAIWTVGQGKNAVNHTPDKFLGVNYFKGIVTIPYRKGYAAIVDAQVGQGPKDKTTQIIDHQRNIINSNIIQPNNGDASVLINK